LIGPSHPRSSPWAPVVAANLLPHWLLHWLVTLPRQAKMMTPTSAHGRLTPPLRSQTRRGVVYPSPSTFGGWVLPPPWMSKIGRCIEKKITMHQTTIYHLFPNLWQHRPPKQEKNVFPSTMKPIKIMVQEGLLQRSADPIVVDGHFRSSACKRASACMRRSSVEPWSGARGMCGSPRSVLLRRMSRGLLLLGHPALVLAFELVSPPTLVSWGRLSCTMS
jgi:hypothetical protein